MRLALGASRARLAWQLMIEAGLLTAVAVILAIPLAWAGLLVSRASIPASVIRFVPGWQYMDISPAIFWSTAALGALATAAFALLPALHSVRADVADTLRQGSRATTAPRQRHWLRNTLAAAQVAVTLALLFGSGLMLTASDGAVNGAFGFDKHNLLTARMVLPERPYADPERRQQFVDRVLERVRAIPAVTQASMVSNLPYGGNNSSREFFPDGVVDTREVRPVHYRRVAGGYLETMKIPLLEGRMLTDADRASTEQVAVVSRRLVDRYWPKGDAIGRRFRLAADGPEITVVGVVGDVLHDWFQQVRFPTVYRPVGQDAPFANVFVVRTVGDPASIAGDVRRAVLAVDPDQPIIELAPMETVVEDRTAGVAFIADAMAVVALIALALAIMGLYSLMAFVVSRRTQELGVRMALGATRWQVVGLATRQGVTITVVGLLAGALAALAMGRLMESTLFGVVSTSAWQLAALSALVAAIAVAASYLPARRMASLDPTVALRTE
jgi:putative ABC transport system permease protein